MYEAFAGLTGFQRIVDDVIIFDNNIEQHAEDIQQFVWRYKEKHITLNIKKWQYTQTDVDFAGFIIPDKGYKINPSITDAISKFPTPSNRTDLCSFFS